MRRWKTYTVRGTHVCLAVGSLDLIFDPDANADYHSRRAEEWAAKLRELEGRQ